jgi:hypothetical protein
MTALNVLVLESEHGGADDASEQLRQAGHNAVRCHEPGSPSFPCNAIASGETCPLESSPVDVAVDVRPRPRSQPAPREDGVQCAIKQHIPLVIVGSETLNPFADYATVIVGADSDVAAACEQAAAAPLRAHSDIAARALRVVLDSRQLSGSPMVAVFRRNGCLVIQVTGAVNLDRATQQMASVRMLAAVRAFDHSSRGIDVVFSGAVPARS